MGSSTIKTSPWKAPSDLHKLQTASSCFTKTSLKYHLSSQPFVLYLSIPSTTHGWITSTLWFIWSEPFTSPAHPAFFLTAPARGSGKRCAEATLRKDKAKCANVFGLSTVSNPQGPLRDADHLWVRGCQSRFQGADSASTQWWVSISWPSEAEGERVRDSRRCLTWQHGSGVPLRAAHTPRKTLIKAVIYLIWSRERRRAERRGMINPPGSRDGRCHVLLVWI